MGDMASLGPRYKCSRLPDSLGNPSTKEESRDAAVHHQRSGPLFRSVPETRIGELRSFGSSPVPDANPVRMASLCKPSLRGRCDWTRFCRIGGAFPRCHPAPRHGACSRTTWAGLRWGESTSQASRERRRPVVSPGLISDGIFRFCRVRAVGTRGSIPRRPSVFVCNAGGQRTCEPRSYECQGQIMEITVE